VTVAERPTDDACWGSPLLTPAERRAKAVLDEIFAHKDSLILPGVKLSQVIRRRPPRVSGEQWNYATRAHFDFVVCDAVTYIPDFAVELDDTSHRQPDGRRRDRMKDAVCEAAGFDLLRVDSHALDRGPRGRRLVEYLIDAREHFRAFGEAQERGDVPPDEIGDYRLIIDQGGFVNDLAGPARLRALKAFQAGSVQGQMIDSYHFSWKDGWTESWAWLQVRDDLYLFEHARLRSYQFHCGIGPQNLAEDLAASAVGEQLPRLGNGEPVLVRRDDMARQLGRLREQRIELGFAIMLDHVRF
jgi:hypothetical protein